MSKRSPKKQVKKSKTRSALAAKRPTPKSAGDAHIEWIARGVLLDATRVLMCESKKHGYLYLPGGHVDFNESAAEACRREFLEECSVPVVVKRPLLVGEGAFDTKKRRHHEINIVFHVEHASPGAFKPSKVKSNEDEIAVRWVELAAVLELDIRPHSAKALLASLGSTDSPMIEWVSEMGN